MTHTDKHLFICAIAGIVAWHLPKGKRTPITKCIRSLLRGNICTADVGTILKTSAGKDVIKRSLMWMKVKSDKFDDDDAMKKYLRAMGRVIAWKVSQAPEHNVENVVPRCSVCNEERTKAHAFCTKDTCMCDGRVVCCDELCDKCAEL